MVIPIFNLWLKPYAIQWMSLYQWFKANCSLQLYLFIHRIMNLFTLSERTMHVLTLATHRRRVQYHSASINIRTVHTWHRYRFGYIFGTFRHNNETYDLAETIDMPWHYAFLFFFIYFSCDIVKIIHGFLEMIIHCHWSTVQKSLRT